MSDTNTLNIVQPKQTYIHMLDSERITEWNLRLNNPGRKIISRMNSDNHHLLLTQVGFQWLRNMGAVNVVTVDKKTVTTINRITCEKLAQEKFYKLVDLRLYNDEIAKMYAKPESITFRSDFTAKSYFEVLNSYGHNRAKTINSALLQKFINVIEQYFGPWLNDPIFEFNFEGFLNTGKWLSHIKTNSNSGYPYNVHQTKELMTRFIHDAVVVFNKYKLDGAIEWRKLPFEMGYRTERKNKHRVICMAPTIEKLISSTISTFLDLRAATLPFNLPRKFGDFKNIFNEIDRTQSNAIVTKDFEGYDTSIPIILFKELVKWFRTKSNTLAYLLAFECELIINSYMVIGPNKLFWIAALPSGIGVTQFIGSLIHWALDLVADIKYKFAMYQSDDNIGLTDMTDKEIQTAFEFIENEFGMSISPIGKKSSYNPLIGKFLQKIIDKEKHIYYNHEQRAFTNGLFRERELSDDTVFELIFNEKDDKEAIHKKQVLAYLGNLTSYGSSAPSLPAIMSFMCNKKNTGFTVNQIKWGLENLQRYVETYLHEEQHRPMEITGWVNGYFNKMFELYGWGEISVVQSQSILSKL